MKKIFYAFAAFAAAAFAISCTDENREVKQPEEGSFTIFADLGTTKTTTDGIKVSWASDDKIKVYHVVSGTTDYVDDGTFTVSDASTGKFTGTLGSELEDGKSYDWYLIYPVNGNTFTSPEQAKMWVGGGSSFTETARAGNLYPMYGKITGLAAGEKVSTTMNQLDAILKIHITNNSNADLAVTSVTFAESAYSDLNSQYDIDFTGDTPVYSLHWGDNKVTMNVKDVTIAPSESYDVYLSTIPFDVKVGETMSLTVNDLKKTNTVTVAKTYAAGTVSTLNFNYNQGVSLTGTAVGTEQGMSQTIENSSVYAWVGTLSAGKLGIRVTDDSGTNYVNAGTTLQEGTKVDVTLQSSSSEITIPSEDTYRVVFDSENNTLVIYNSANEFNNPLTVTWRPNNNSALAEITTEVTDLWLRGSAAGWSSAGKDLQLTQSLADPKVFVYSGSSFSGSASFAIISSYSYDGNGDGTEETYNVNNSYVFTSIRVDPDGDGVQVSADNHSDTVTLGEWTDMDGGADLRGNYFNCTSSVNYITFDFRNMKIKFEKK